MTRTCIAFNGPMIRAILYGRKTQTRRVAKLTDGGHVKEPNGHRRWHPQDLNALWACPYGEPGDLLWVREAWQEYYASSKPQLGRHEAGIRYDADAAERILRTDVPRYGGSLRRDGRLAWRPPSHMPRWASRLTLRLTGVRIERLRSITEPDALAEGYSSASAFLAGEWAGPLADRNPFVWVLDFEPIHANVDDVIAQQEHAA